MIDRAAAGGEAYREQGNSGSTSFLAMLLFLLLLSLALYITKDEETRLLPGSKRAMEREGR